MALNKWDQLKLLLPDTEEARLLIINIERQINFVANNVAEIKANAPDMKLTDPTLFRLSDTFGIQGKAVDEQ